MSADRPAPTLTTPGELLRRGRIAKGWSQTAAAKSLRLPVLWLAALENDEYHLLPGELYIRGYWKNYAKLLNISIDESVAAYGEKLRAETAGAGISDTAPRVYLPWPLAYLLMGALLLFAGGLWHKANPPPAIAADSPVDAVLVLQGLEEWVAQLPGATRPSTGAETPSATQATRAAASNAELVFIVTQPSWLEVRDAAGAPLLRGHAKQGERLAVRGRSPFAVFLGNADGVAVEYQGEEFRVPDRDRLFARFQVGAHSVGAH